MKSNSRNWLPFLDGIRGFAALWVLASHSLKLCGWSLPILKSGGLAVDIFMIMSGFLMTYHYCKREDVEPWHSPKTWYTFYIRRFYRIAPLYYLLLIIALSFSSHLGDSRQAIAAHFPGSSTDMSRYQNTSILNVFLHITFLFGLFPDYAFSTPLPDWSIGLEMQFYIFFPFIMLLFKKFSCLLPTLLLYLISLISKKVFTGYPMPTLLVLKLDLFVIGILLALAYHQRLKKYSHYWMAAILSIIVAVNSAFYSHERFAIAIPILTVILLLLLFYDRTKDLFRIGKFIRFVDWLLSNKIASFLGDTSYSIYLLHLIVLVPLAALLASSNSYINLPGAARFSILTFSTAMPSYCLACYLYKYIEKPGVTLGKTILKANSAKL